jgi:hypothetical protein
MGNQKMSDFEWQTKAILGGIAGAIASKIAAVCRQKMAFYDPQGVLKRFLRGDGCIFYIR